MSSPTPSIPLISSPSPDAGLSIAAVEREAGLGKDTLRAWERRYGFPTPSRDAFGDRLYSPGQVQQLKLISRLLDAGLRPGKVVGLDSAALLALLSQMPSVQNSVLSKTMLVAASDESVMDELLQCIGSHDPRALRHGLSRAQARMGLAPFITGLVAPLTTAVGEAWAQGRFEVFEEHLYTEVITGVLRQAIASMTSMASEPVAQGPKVLLTTVPQEQHSLGLLMVEALLALEGCTCVSLGTQTPLSDIAQAAQVHHADVVALSFSNLHKSAIVKASLVELRAQLPQATALWVGGACSALYRAPVAGVSAMQELAGLQAAVAQWRLAH